MALVVVFASALDSPDRALAESGYAQQFPTLPPIFTMTPFISPTPTIVPTLTALPPPTQAGCGTPLGFTPGQYIAVESGLNIRTSPSASAPLLTYFSEKMRVRIAGGPVCADGYNWWQVGGFGDTGWVIEGRSGRYFLEPAIIPVTDPCYTPLSFAVDMPIRANRGVRIRNAPTQTAYTITVVPADGQMTVLEGPRCVSGINWWRVIAPFQTSNVPIEGWVAEGFPGDYYVERLDPITLEPFIPCVLPLTLGTGSHIAVNYFDGVPRRLRAAPNVNAPLVLEMPDEIALEIIADEPVCANGYNWWNVRVLTTGYVGWIAEGRPGRYNIEIIAP
jgi:hypothetical protein